jgi:hypothetical protein
MMLCASTYIWYVCVFHLQKMVELCKNRVVLFDNMSKDPRVEAKQVEKLIDVVDSVCANNGGKSFSDQMLTRIKVNYSFCCSSCGVLVLICAYYIT